jgi:HD-like signal output (HDOD) protein
VTSTPRSGRALTPADLLKAAALPGTLGTGAWSVPRLLTTLFRPDASARDVANVARQHPAMTAAVLRIANSALYGQTRAVATLDHAVLLLGLETVRGIAAATSMREALLRRDASVPVDGAALLRHGVATAVAAHALARTARPALASEAFVAALLHDLGIALLARASAEGAAAVAEALRADPALDVATVEQAALGMDHAQAAAIVFATWQLPDALVAAVRHHDDPGAAPEPCRPLAALVTLGNALSLGAGFGSPSEPARDVPCTEAAALLGLPDEAVAAVAATLRDDVAGFQRLLFEG